VIELMYVMTQALASMTRFLENFSAS